MWTSPKLVSGILCVALMCAAHAFAADTPSTNNMPKGLSFTYDAQHDQINASGMQMNAAPLATPTLPPTTGTITVTVNVKVVTKFRPGTEYHCTLAVIGGVLDQTNGIAGGGIETTNGMAMPDGTGIVVCTLTIPYSWTIPPAPAGQTGIIIAFGASAIKVQESPGHGFSSHEFSQSPQNQQNQVLRSTLQVEGVAPLPSNGGSQSYVFDAAL